MLSLSNSNNNIEYGVVKKLCLSYNIPFYDEIDKKILINTINIKNIFSLL